MESLRNLGGTLARHYEKVLLGVALVGLVYAVYHLYSKKQSEEENIQQYNLTISRKQTQGVPATDLAAMSNALAQAKAPPSLNFGLPHNLFNPVKWQRRPDGTIIKIETGAEVGPAALKVSNVSPLNTIIGLERPSASGLFMNVQQEASTNAGLRRRLQVFVTPNTQDRWKVFTLREIAGTAEKPEAVIELATGERATVTADKPFTRPEGFKADMQYPPENKTFKDARVGDVLPLAGQDYIIIAINTNETVVSARSNNRRTTIRNNTGP